MNLSTFWRCPVWGSPQSHQTPGSSSSPETLRFTNYKPSETLSRHISNSTFATATYLSQGNLTSSLPRLSPYNQTKTLVSWLHPETKVCTPWNYHREASKSPATWPQGRGLPVLQRFLRFLKKCTEKSSTPSPHHHRPSGKCSLSQVIKLFFSGPHLKSKPEEKSETQ